MSRKGEFNTKYSPEFKIAVIMDMRENHLSYCETARKYWAGEREDNYKNRLKERERVYLEEGAAGFMIERRGRKSTGRSRKKPLDKKIENDLIAENQRLRERLEYVEAGCFQSLHERHGTVREYARGRHAVRYFAGNLYGY